MSDQNSTGSISGGVSSRVLAAGSCLPFGEIEPQDLVAATKIVVDEGNVLLERLESGPAAGDSADLMDLLEVHHDRFERVYSVGGLYQATCDSAEWRAAWAEAQPLLTEFLSRWGQSRAVYDTLCVLQGAEGATPARRRLLDSLVQEMELAGVALEHEERARFRAIQAELASLSTTFAQTALDARKAWSHTVTEPSQMEGMPAAWRRMAAAAARENGFDDATMDDGPWRVTLDRSVAWPVLQHCRHRPLREMVRRGILRVAADAPHDNSPTVARILTLRREQSQLLGFENYIDMSMARKMAGGRANVESLIDRIVEASRETSRRDVDHLRALAQAAGAPEAEDFQVWDERFWAERDREARVGISDDHLRPYFAFEHVRTTLFALVERLFGVRFEARPELSVWHDDVTAYAMVDADSGAERAYLYVDAYARPQTKRAGAWMAPLVGRSRALGTSGVSRRPAAAICCNQTPPVDDTPSLMSFREVTTLFHEMGHALHHLVSEADDVRQAGVAGVEWDAVELPSIFLESWVYHRPTLGAMARHYQTGESLSEETVERLIAARAHLGASMLLAQSSFTRLDLNVHDSLDAYTPEHIHRLGLDTLRATRTLAPLEGDRMLCSFAHLFAGGYAAGYYSYIWAGVLARDAFAAFTDLEGDVAAEARLGRRWRQEVLAPGGTVHPMALFERFRGRAPDVTAMLQWYGVNQNTASA